MSIIIDGKEIEQLRDYPIRVKEEGLNRYFGDIAYLIVNDKQNDETQFNLLIKKTKEIEKEKPNGDIVGVVPPEKLKYTQYTLDKQGDFKNTTFSFSKRNGLQTELLNAGNLGPYRIGYYTNAWEAYPVFFFPFLYPFLTLVIGLILILIFIPIKRRNKRAYL